MKWKIIAGDLSVKWCMQKICAGFLHLHPAWDLCIYFHIFLLITILYYGKNLPRKSSYWINNSLILWTKETDEDGLLQFLSSSMTKLIKSSWWPYIYMAMTTILCRQSEGGPPKGSSCSSPRRKPLPFNSSWMFSIYLQAKERTCSCCSSPIRKP